MVNKKENLRTKLVKSLPDSLKLVFRQFLHLPIIHGLFYSKVSDLKTYQFYFDKKSGLEIGGPSRWSFSKEGCVPVYDILNKLDNVLYSSETLYGEFKEGYNFKYHTKKDSGYQFISEVSNMSSFIEDNKYEFILSSHTLEHIANPLGALKEWMRVLEEGGVLLLVLPHKEGTFDCFREITPLKHIVEDYNKNTTEDDSTHFSEIFTLQEKSFNQQDLEKEGMENFMTRRMHHHVFDTFSAIQLVDYSGFEILKVDAIKPFNIVILARKCNHTPNNSKFLGNDADYKKHSYFLIDREKNKQE